MRTLRIPTLTILILSTMSGCGQEAPEGSGEVTEAGSHVNLAEIALVENAHRKFGDRVYSDEVISPAMGVMKVCGRMHPTDNPVRITYYEFSIEGAKEFLPEQRSVWAARCEFGWRPGSGM